jgi:thiosulfate/3-mercaptopyruvate sulfurtransferase
MPETNLLIDCAKLARIMDDPGVRVIDCRFELLDRDAGQRRYVEGHLPGAVFADLDRDLAAPVTSGTGRHPLPDASIMAGTFARLGISNSSRVVVYDDDNGALASRCWWLLRWLGHDDARLLDGGFARWRSLGLPIEAGDRQPAAVDFRPSPRPELVLETQEIAAAGTNRAALQLVDARDSARFAGRHEPIDPVAGHIPGAINLPFPASLDAHGGWRSATELQKLWRRTLGDGFGRPWSTMCGSGVTACHLVVSGLLAGLPEPRVYVGSWSEWITDTSRPVAVGEG